MSKDTTPDIMDAGETTVPTNLVEPTLGPVVVNDKAVVKKTGKLEMHEVDNGYVVIQDGRAFGVKKDDFQQVQRLLAGQDIVQYNTAPKGQEQSPWHQQRNINIKELSAVAMACEGIVVIHKLQNCYMIVGPQGAYLTSTTNDALVELNKLFTTL